MATGEPLEQEQTDSEISSRSANETEGAAELPRVPPEIRDVSFTVSLRGYEREEVDAYVTRVNHLIAELDVSHSPEAAVRHALEQVGEQTRDLLERAGKTAEEITLAARQEAEESTARAKGEAEEIVAKAQAEADEILDRSKAEADAIAAESRKEAEERLQRSRDEVATLQEEAEARMRELDADTESIRRQRLTLLDDLRGIAAQVAETASSAEARFSLQELAESPDEETADLEPATQGSKPEVGSAAEPQDGSAGREDRSGP